MATLPCALADRQQSLPILLAHPSLGGWFVLEKVWQGFVFLDKGDGSLGNGQGSRPFAERVQSADTPKRGVAAGIQDSVGNTSFFCPFPGKYGIITRKIPYAVCLCRRCLDQRLRLVV